METDASALAVEPVVLHGKDLHIYGKGKTLLGRTGPYDDRILAKFLPQFLDGMLVRGEYCFGDIGTGNGKLAELFHRVLTSGGRSCKRTVLSDPNEKHRAMILNREEFAAAVVAGQLQIGEVDLYHEFPAEFGEFDLLTCVSVLMHINDEHIEAVVRRMMKAMKVGGKLLVVTKNPLVAEALYKSLGGNRYGIPETTIEETYRSRVEYEKLFLASGAKIVHSSHLPVIALEEAVIPGDYQSIAGHHLWDVLLVTPKS